MENKSGFSTACRKCGKTIYEGEMLNIKGNYVCEGCAESHLFGKHCCAPKRKRVPSPFFHFIMSLHPGAGHMYLGFMKKGLFQMCLFYMCIYLISNFDLAAFVIPIICMYSFFDSLSLRRRLVNGEEISDDLYSEKMFFNRNMGLIAIVVLIMLASGVVASLFGGVVSINNKRPEITLEQPIVQPPQPPRPHSGVILPDAGSTATYYVTVGRGFNMAKPLILTGLGALVVYNVSKRHKRKKTRGECGWTYEHNDGDK